MRRSLRISLTPRISLKTRRANDSNCFGERYAEFDLSHNLIYSRCMPQKEVVNNNKVDNEEEEAEEQENAAEYHNKIK